MFSMGQVQTQFNTDEIKKDIKDLKIPVQQLTDLRRRFVGILFLAGSIFSATGVLLGPFLRDGLVSIYSHVWWR